MLCQQLKGLTFENEGHKYVCIFEFGTFLIECIFEQSKKYPDDFVCLCVAGVKTLGVIVLIGGKHYHLCCLLFYQTEFK